LDLFDIVVIHGINLISAGHLCALQQFNGRDDPAGIIIDGLCFSIRASG